MKVIIPGHSYELENFVDSSKTQVIEFINKKPKAENLAELELVHDGTTNEEILAMLIDRLEFLYHKLPSIETIIALQNCKEALAVLNNRTIERELRGVEGTHIK